MPVDSFFPVGAATSLSPSEIERELSSMWKPINEAEGASVSRVVLGNVLWIGRESQAERIRSVFQSVAPKYPARVFLIILREGDNPEITATVAAQCFRPKAGDIPVCCEMITLYFTGKSGRHVRGCVAPLLLADIQTVLLTTLDPEEFPQIKDLQQHVDRTISMASLAADPAAVLRGCFESEQSCFDLSWFRMIPIRQQVSAFFDDAAQSFRLDKISEVRVSAVRRSSGSTLPELMSALFVGWIAARMKWTVAESAGGDFQYASAAGPVTVRLEQCEAGVDCGAATLTGITLRDRDGSSFDVSLAGQRMNMVASKGESHLAERHLFLSELDEADALGTALNTPMTVRYFRQAATLAAPLLEKFLTMESK
ncbi:glucose-6-phosphate dehydrogenase assembly protein OpcA [soil metagenome]